MMDKLSEKFILGFFALVFLLVILGALITFCREAFATPEEWCERCRPYELQVKEILKNNGLSTDYYYLMVAESRCTQNAKSNKGALGFWQLMPDTSRYYGCFHPDDIECSTNAAAKYIKHLEKDFYDFDSVVAAYNMGGHNLKKRGMSKEAKNLVFTVKRLRECM